MNLKELRKQSGLKAYKIAEKLNISRVQFNNIESGRTKINEEKVYMLSDIYKRNANDIRKAWEVSIIERTGNII